MREWFLSHYQEFLHDFNQSFIEDDRWLYIVKGLGITITVAVGALILGVIFGVIVAVIRSAHDQRKHKKTKDLGYYILGVLDFFCKIYLTVIRGTPMMVQLLIMYFVIFASSTNNLFLSPSSRFLNLKKKSMTFPSEHASKYNVLNLKKANGINSVRLKS